MVGTTLLAGGVILAILLVLGFIMNKSTSKTSYAAFYPSFLMVAVGLVLLLLATMTKVDIMGAGYGGWGIASLFAAAITMIVLSIIQTKPDTN
ncbi:hypothetical protein JNUCC1_02855 [Lentibacillus sp. JNUCC-1]|uniref:hypothetical protein n=1 Tax=Lentibacillus sp. JNUCC-1 TaxID=2654513 RepID=UPI0012E6FA46|nr:hypothetical protein [Lentibacillus sp. JNUCC-1]MUV38983.1 hypothetical protein [Lentibacillus sp. JNUCC-1]